MKFMPCLAVFTYRSSIYKYIVKHVNILDWNLFYLQMTSLASIVLIFKMFPFLKILIHLQEG